MSMKCIECVYSIYGTCHCFWRRIPSLVGIYMYIDFVYPAPTGVPFTAVSPNESSPNKLYTMSRVARVSVLCYILRIYRLYICICIYVYIIPHPRKSQMADEMEW